MLTARFHSPLVTYSHRKAMPLSNLLVTLIDHTCTHNPDGIWLGNFGNVGEMNFFRAFRSDKNGIQENKTLKLGSVAEGRNGQW